MSRKEMKGFWVVVLLLCFFLWSAVPSHGSVIYEFVVSRGSNSGAIKGELEFLDTVAKADTGWTAPLENLSTLLNGGISGFRWAFGSGLESALAGEIFKDSGSGDLISLYGTSLDRGCGEGFLTFPSGIFWLRLSLADFDSSVGVGYSDQTYDCWIGNWVLQTSQTPQTPIPEPSTLILFGIGMLGVLGYGFSRKRRKEK